ncbi:MAG: T9SS type A sorting domain-containing protein [Bacteroidales bacterium]|nr:T9SS type A sorting domain-containing protein [Bacteroidales bacterium]
MAQYPTTNYLFDVVAIDNLVYITDHTHLRILNVIDPISPVEIGNYSPGTNVYDLEISNSVAYIAAYNILRIVDISNPELPTELGMYYTTGIFEYCNAVCVQESFAYVYFFEQFSTNNPGLHILNVSDPTSPYLVSQLNYADMVFDIEVSDNYLYMSFDSGELVIIDVSNPTNPVEINNIQYQYPIVDIHIVENTAYFVPEEIKDLYVVNISNPYLLEIVEEYSNINHPSKNVFVSDSLAYIASPWSGMYILDVSLSGEISLAAQIESKGTSNDIFIEDDELFLANGKSGLIAFEIDTAGNIFEISNFPVDNDASDIWVSDNKAFIADAPYGYKIIDIQDLGNLIFLGQYNEFIRSVCAKDNYVYQSNSGGGLQISEISNPAFPLAVGSYDLGGAGWDIFIDENLIFYADGQNGMHIIDVSDPGEPIHLSQYDYGDNVYDVFASDTLAYVANGALGLRIIDISDPININELSYAYIGNVKGIWVAENLAYAAVSDFGLKVIDVNDPANPIEIASFESGGNATMAIPNGDYIYLSDGDDGIYVLQMDFTTDTRSSNKTFLKEFILIGNSPNPFLTDSKIQYKVLNSCNLSLSLYDAYGKEIKLFENEFKKPGDYYYNINDLIISQGIYFYQLSNGEISIVKKMLKL